MYVCTCTCMYSLKPEMMYVRVFDKLIMAPLWPKELLIWHYMVLSLGQMAQLIMIILPLTALTLC